MSLPGIANTNWHAMTSTCALFQGEPQSFALSSKVETSGGLVCEVLSLMAAGQLYLGLGNTLGEVSCWKWIMLAIASPAALLHLNAARGFFGALMPNALPVARLICVTYKGRQTQLGQLILRRSI